jgi:hypothetical protein
MTTRSHVVRRWCDLHCCRARSQVSSPHVQMQDRQEGIGRCGAEWGVVLAVFVVRRLSR